MIAPAGSLPISSCSRIQVEGVTAFITSCRVSRSHQDSRYYPASGSAVLGTDDGSVEAFNATAIPVKKKKGTDVDDF